MTTFTFYDIIAPSPLGGRTWGRFWLTADGCLSVYSDYGAYGYWWDAPGPRGIKSFLASAGHDYVATKLARGRSEFDAEATVKRIRREIIELRRDLVLDREEAREEWRLTEGLDSERDFERWTTETVRLGYEYPELCGWAEYVIPFQLQGFMQVLWPKFVEALQDELARENSPPAVTEERTA